MLNTLWQYIAACAAIGDTPRSLALPSANHPKVDFRVLVLLAAKCSLRQF